MKPIVSGISTSAQVCTYGFQVEHGINEKSSEFKPRSKLQLKAEFFAKGVDPKLVEKVSFSMFTL